MGLTKKSRKKYEKPGHPWQGERIQEEKKIVKNYGLKNKKEVWKFSTIIKGFKDQAKKLTARNDKQAEKEKKQLIERLNKIGLLQKDATMESILDLSIEDILNRRLQTILISRGIARTIKQSRQFITHGHVKINEKKIDVPSYIVKLQEEPTIAFAENSSYNDSDHPERIIAKKETKKAVTPVKKQEQKVDKTRTQVKPLRK